MYGSLIPLALYLIWEFIIVGMLPLEGENGLAMVAAAAHPVGSLADAMHAIYQASGKFFGWFFFFCFSHFLSSGVIKFE